MGNKQIKIAFKVGDRVAEKPKPVGIFRHHYIKAVEAGITSQRHGTVTNVYVNQNSRDKRRLVYVEVQWDHLKSPVAHLQNRLCKEQDLLKEQELYRNAL